MAIVKTKRPKCKACRRWLKTFYVKTKQGNYHIACAARLIDKMSKRIEGLKTWRNDLT